MITQGTFALLPELTDDEIEAEVRYALDHGWAISVEHTDDPHPRNTYWELWDLPMFDLADSRGAMIEVNSCREGYPDHYVKVVAFDNSKGRETVALTFMVQQPATEPGFGLERQGRPGRTLGYSAHPYAADRPHGARYN